jgi:putative nucleotidyltransferase with HDIG domain
VIYALFILYLVFIRPMFLRDNLRLLVLNGGIVAIAVLGLISRQIDPSFHPEYIIVVPVFAMLLAILFDARTSFYVIVTTALLVMGITGNDFQILLGTLLSGTFTIYTIRDLRGRTQIFKSIASIFIGYSLPVLAFGLSLSLAPIDIAFQLVQAGANAVLCPLIVLGLLFVIEHTTSITTDLRLQEYDNLSHPLLVQLSDRAPGTYQHTLSVARLAESAAQAIGANSQLVKIGAYFHDIGKMTKAEYFVENQLNIGNKHDRLSPQKSTAVIKSHVTLGLELAKEYKLPERIIDFIPMHHGTTLIRYFYVKALEKAEQKGGEEAKALIKEEDFRYAGPVPASKEAAILMLADGVEAVSHTMDTSNKDALEKMVDGIARERLLDGQFDNCDLSLKELATVKRSLVKNLLGMGHHRVQYKEIPKMAPQKEHNGEQKPQATPQART